MGQAQTDVPERLHVQEADFSLVGCGVRELLWQEIYVLSFYTGPERARMLRLDVVYDGDMPKHMPADWRPHLAKVASADTLARIDAAFAEIKTGDVLQFAYLPHTDQSILAIDQSIRMAVPGEALYDAVHAMWLGDKPISNRLKSTILNRVCKV